MISALGQDIGGRDSSDAGRSKIWSRVISSNVDPDFKSRKQARGIFCCGVVLVAVTLSRDSNYPLQEITDSLRCFLMHVSLPHKLQENNSDIDSESAMHGELGHHEILT